MEALTFAPALIHTELLPILDPASLLQGLGPATLAVVALIIFIESGVLFPFLPGDSLLFTAGLLHQQLNLTLPVLITVVAVAAIAGDQVGYLLGRRFGRRWFSDDARVLKTARLTKAEEFFRRRGGPALLLARFVPVVRTFAPLSAGIARYDYKSFALWNVTGAILWATSVTLLGSWLGRFDFVSKNIDLIAIVMVLVSVLPWGIEFLKRKRARKPESDQQARMDS
ncbi:MULTISPECIES: VTT domain-containing protein [Paenarthrobacter]|jgi:membrane-associated protein|uniref:DedA family protein n=1 Tax=Paenarthrobacter TaxID=1742992 RepID=UPI00057CB81F|nr:MULTISPECIES: VTT domain-containing protein [Paenarthrobacter]KQR01755.1 alkaline phosphatase [Arthrobacter sp. Leaf145]BCW10131.1 membrane protein [Arthrobacter sp. NtRootA2]BCW14211.1 membrane protein [Arthrobacter sp. NtRootA4]BCW22547.1 membrane protein [Arthrobacter sp. NtRootC7]BCW26816.1 membrane protein [Arthrobacter sp. NtRootC45]BCW31086.1 membrane protein [Arthrobacter sp. NtRootD5]